MIMEILKTIGKRIRFARIERGLSMRDLARKVNVSQQTIFNYENGNCNPPSAMLVHLARELKCPCAWFFIDSKKLYKAVRELAFQKPVGESFVLQCKTALERAKVLIETIREGEDYAHTLFYIDKAIEATEREQKDANNE